MPNDEDDPSLPDEDELLTMLYGIRLALCRGHPEYALEGVDLLLKWINEGVAVAEKIELSEQSPYAANH